MKKMIKGVNSIFSMAGGKEVKEVITILEGIEKDEAKAEEIASPTAKSFIQVMFDKVDAAVEKVMAAEAERIAKKESGKELPEEKPPEVAKETEEATLPKDKTALRKAVIERETFKEAVARQQAEEKAKEEEKPTTEGKEPEVVSSPTK